MSLMKIGNAPVSWGIYGPTGPGPAFNVVLDAIAEAGYQGTELGPYGYLPTASEALAKELQTRRLGLGSSYIGVALEDPTRRAAAVEECLQVGRLLATQGVTEIIVADDDAPERMAIAGRVPADGSAGWSDAQWREATATLNAIGAALKKALGMRVVVHHHVGTYLETQQEIARMLEETDPGLVGLLLDTGHVVYGGGDPVALYRAHAARTWYVHLKDVRADELNHVRTSDIGMREAWKRGVFCPLGQGVVAFPELISALKANGYAGWLIVEQDVVPDASGRLEPDPFECAKKSRNYLREIAGI